MENNLYYWKPLMTGSIAAKNVRDDEALAYLVKITRLRKKVGLP